MNTSDYKNYYKEKIAKRQEANMEILEVLKDYMNKYPSIRFSQALCNLGIIRMDEKSHNIIDPFFEESVDILKRINQKA